MSDLLDELEDRKAEPEFGGDYSPWWEPSEGDRLVGVVAEVHSAPSRYTPEGEIPPPVYTIVSIGEGKYDLGSAYSTRTHKQLLRGFDDVDLGDVVLLEYEGYKKFEGSTQPSNAYEIAVIKKDELEDFDEEWQDLVEMALSEYGGPTGDNRRTDPVSSDESERDDASADDEPSKEETDNLTEAASFLKKLLEMQDGEIPVDQADKMLNDVREFGVDIEETAMMIGAEIDGDTLKA